MSEKACNNSSCDKTSCEGCPSREKKPASFQVDANEYSCIRRVIGVVSGKGGVGKSMVTASIANELAAKGYQVGILDADITGPSIPRMYGIHGPAEASDMGIEPRVTKNGIKLMSMNLLLPAEDTPVIWRGPIIANIVKQFWTDVIWGDLDYLLVDMPPGTGDVPLTVFQSLPVSEIVVVTSPPVSYTHLSGWRSYLLIRRPVCFLHIPGIRNEEALFPLKYSNSEASLRHLDKNL